MINYKYGTYAAKSVVGLVRTNNEDVFCVDAEKSLFVLADGMGGHSRGELASSEATKTIMNFIAGWRSKGNDLSGKNGIEIVQQAFHAANSELEKRNGDA